MSSASYPSVDAYLATLCDGWSSFPECQVNASLVLGLRARGAFDGLDRLPEAIAAQLSGVVPETAWFPEVLGVGVFLAVRDARFPGLNGEHDFLMWVEALNHEILDAQQRALDARTPADAVHLLPGLWARFHRGTTMRVVAHGAQHAEIAFAHPPALFPREWTESRRRTLVSALVRAGAVQPEVRAAADGARGTTFRLVWR